MNLYEINERLQLLEEFNIDNTTGEYLTDEEFTQRFNEIEMDLNTKIENTCLFIKNLQADSLALKDEMSRLKTRKEQKDKLAERLQRNLDTIISQKFYDDENVLDFKAKNKYKFETPKCKISYRKSDTVEITDIEKLPSEYVTEVIDKKADKTSIKKYLKASEDNKVEGAILINNLSMQIK